MQPHRPEKRLGAIDIPVVSPDHVLKDVRGWGRPKVPARPPPRRLRNLTLAWIALLCNLFLAWIQPGPRSADQGYQFSKLRYGPLYA